MLGHAAGFGYDIRSNKPLSPRMAIRRGGRTSAQAWRRQRGHADAEARRSVLTALACATLVTLGCPEGWTAFGGVGPLRAGRRGSSRPHPPVPRPHTSHFATE